MLNSKEVLYAQIDVVLAATSGRRFRCHGANYARNANDAGRDPGPPLDNNQIGSSKLKGVHTKILYGDPSKAGFYTILLYVPAHTTIQAHSHHDNRMATVVSGEWHIGYGNRFEGNDLKTLPPGSVYSEPGGDNHFAQTSNDDVIVEISGYGPTDTRYVEAKHDPKSHKSD